MVVVSGLALLGLAALYFLAVLVLGWLAVNRDWVQAEQGVEIRVWSTGVHTDFVLPVRTPQMDWSAFAPLEGNPAPPWCTHVVVGWGDHDFYVYTPRYEDFSLPRTLEAVFLPTSSVMHVQYQSYMPRPGAYCVKLVLTEAEYSRLVAFLRASFAVDAACRPVLVPGAAYGEVDAFYRGVGSYHLFATCNNWANSALQRTGVRTAVWSPFAYAIFDHVKNR